MDKEQRYPLHYAYNLPTEDIAGTLLQHGAVPVSKDEARKPLHLSHRRQPSQVSEEDQSAPATPVQSAVEINFFDSLSASLTQVEPMAGPQTAVSLATPPAAAPNVVRSPLDLNAIDEDELARELAAETPRRLGSQAELDIRVPRQKALRHVVPQRRSSSPLARQAAGSLTRVTSASPTSYGSDSEV
jgi:hypothetical protein